MGKKRLCGLDGCDGIMNITYLRRREGGDIIRTRTCSKCKRHSHSIEVDTMKYEKMRILVKELQSSISRFME